MQFDLQWSSFPDKVNYAMFAHLAPKTCLSKASGQPLFLVAVATGHKAIPGQSSLVQYEIILLRGKF